MKDKISKSNRRILLYRNKLLSSKLLYSITGSLLTIVLICGLVMSASSANASNSEGANVSVIVNSSCSITTGGGNYARTISPGTTEEITGNGINVTCNDSAGYALYTVGFSGDSYDTTNNTKMLAVAGTNYIPTATSSATSPSDHGSYWAMKATGSSSLEPSTAPTIDNSFDDYHVIPSTYTKLSHYTGSTLGTTTNSVTTPSYKVYVGTAQPASTYVGKVKYTLVHPNDVPVANNMQNWTGCSTMAIGSETFLKDTRDGKFYRIAKFNDGKCWMAENLDIAGGTALSSTDTDFDSSYELPTTNGWTVNDGKLILPQSSTQGFSTDNYAYVYNSDNSTSGCSAPGCYSYYSWDTATLGSGRSIAADNTDAPYSICPKGWHLPNTRTGTDSTSDLGALMIALGGSASIQTYSTNTIPTGNAIYNSLASAPLNFLRGGHYSNGVFGDGNLSGFYWSSTSFSSGIHARALRLMLTYVDVAFNSYRSVGYSVRCMANT